MCLRAFAPGALNSSSRRERLSKRKLDEIADFTDELVLRRDSIIRFLIPDP
jgi:hypothetical protein